MKKLILSNAKIVATPGSTTEDALTKFEIDLRDKEIFHETLIPNLLRVIVSEMNTGKQVKKKCACCGDDLGGAYAQKRIIKILKVTDPAGYIDIDFKTPDEKAVFSQIIEKVREELFHGEYLCPFCPDMNDEQAKYQKEQSEIYLAELDVRKMYSESKKIQNLR